MIRPDAPESLANDLDAVALRLDMILSNLPNFPVTASNDLDVAWQLLLARMPKPVPTISTTRLLELTFTPTPHVTVTPTVASYKFTLHQNIN